MEIHSPARRDPLTNLPGRSLFSDLLRQALNRARRQHTGLAVLQLDLDGLRTINRCFGQTRGDRLLQTVAAALRDCLRRADTICRLEQDEFAVLVEEVHTVADVEPLCGKIHRALTRALLVEPGGRIGTSIGVAIYPQHGADAHTLLQRAEEAMYSVKQSGSGGFALARYRRRRC